MQDATGGDPMSGIKWARKSTRNLSKELRRQGYAACPNTVGRLLKGEGYSLRINVKRISGQKHPQREEQFQYLQKRVAGCRQKGFPVISVDTKKKELVGNFFNAGRNWRQTEIAVSDHDFPSEGIGKAIPYGIYDVTHNRGFVAVGTSSETAQFGVDSVAMWFARYGRQRYPDADRLLILADNGGCNGSRNRLWKVALQEIADRFCIRVDVIHYPPGASKWNPIEHRLFSFISKNWAGQPLRTHDRVVNFIRATQTRGGLRVGAALVSKLYTPGIKISEEQMDALHLRRARILPQWNYALLPRTQMVN